MSDTADRFLEKLILVLLRPGADSLPELEKVATHRLDANASPKSYSEIERNPLSAVEFQTKTRPFMNQEVVLFGKINARCTGVRFPNCLITLENGLAITASPYDLQLREAK